MLRTRLIVGTILTALAGGMLFLDESTAPWFPFLFATVVLLSILGTFELVRLLPGSKRPNLTLCVSGVCLVVILNWAPTIRISAFTGFVDRPTNAWWFIGQGLAIVLLLAFFVEMAKYREPGGAVERIALAVWVIGYMGLLPCFLMQLRLEPHRHWTDILRQGTVALALAIFVPKGCDIGAYFTGRLLGRHRMTPVLSPKKTWEGAFGGLALAVAIAFGLNSLDPVIPGGSAGVIGFGLTVGLAGMLGDLAESLIKRDCERKDASAAIPGFGGILDVVDSILFAAPVAYWWLH
jgi:phosphatidate cytidylyltransferase